jgi:hypothetical protein
MLEASNSYKVLPHSHSMTDLNGVLSYVHYVVLTYRLYCFGQKLNYLRHCLLSSMNVLNLNTTFRKFIFRSFLGPPLTRIKNHKLHAINEMRSIKSERNNLALSMPILPPIPVRSRMIQLPGGWWCFVFLHTV